MNNKGQGAIEYLLIITAAILVVAIVILAITGALGGGQEQTNTSLVSLQTGYSQLEIILNYHKTGLLFGSEITPSEETKLANSLLGLWHWNSDYIDSGINSIVTTPISSPTFTSGLWGTEALQFNFVEDKYVQIHADTLKPQQVTYSVWFNPTQSNNNFIFALIYSIDGDGANPNSGMHSRGYAQVNTAGEVFFSSGVYTVPNCNGKWVDRTTVGGVMLGQWNHFVATIDFDNSQKTRIYLNGVFQAETESVDVSGCTNNVEYIWIGRKKTDATNTYNFDGSIEEFAIFDRLFSDKEIKDLFDKGAAFSE